MDLGIIGIGKVGLALSDFCAKAGSGSSCVFKGFFSRRQEYAFEIASKYNVYNYVDINELVSSCDIIFITTIDNEISKIVDAILPMHNLDNKVFVHCSGALSSEVFQPLITKGAKGYSLHPLHAFVGNEQDMKGLETCYVTIEGHADSKEELASIQHVLALFEGRYAWIETDKKVLYHGAAVMLSNYLVTLVHEGYKYLSHMGLSEVHINKMMIPLLEGTVTNIKHNGTVKGLTGPIIRGDDSTILRHLNALDQFLGSEEKSFYKLMGLKTLEMVKETRMNTQSYETLKRLFE